MLDLVTGSFLISFFCEVCLPWSQRFESLCLCSIFTPGASSWVDNSGLKSNP